MGNEIETLIEELGALYKTDKHPFPYNDCRKLQRGNKLFEGFVPDLDLYFKDIAGCCSRPRSLLKWSGAKRELIQQKVLSRSFFEKNPDYVPLESQITEKNTPHLYADLALHNKMRATLNRLFSLLGKYDLP